MTAAVRQCEASGVDLLVVLHLAYSPSLESLPALRATRLPLLLLDTTMDARFDQAVAPERIMYNHGIHGVMDLASVLRREGRAFEIAAGHLALSPVIERAAELARAARAAHRLRRTKALRIGPTFAGMGDFAVPEEVLSRVLGITVDEVAPGALAPWIAGVTPAALAAEMAEDAARCVCLAPAAVHRRSTLIGLGLRALLADGGYDAFSMNFLAFTTPDDPVSTLPFQEAGKAMARGIGYGGEGDVLTAALVGALARGFGDTTFTEIFCPDWQGGSLFLSHMGEVNPALAASTPHLVEYDFPFTAARNPLKLACALRPGPAVFVNLAPGPRETFSLLLAPVEMLPDTTNTAFAATIRGWMRPRLPLPAFLEAYSRHGGTHHSALVYGDRTEALAAFARFAGLEYRIIA